MMPICLIVFLAFPVIGVVASIVVVAKDSVHKSRCSPLG
jgi:hypothetical protein